MATAIVPSAALGVPWHAWTASRAVALFVGAAAGLRAPTRRRAEPGRRTAPAARGPALLVKGFVTPHGLASLDKSQSWEKIYDNGEARIYRWRGTQPQ